jgi:hypothetical protein
MNATFNTFYHVERGKHGDFTRSMVKVIVSDYRYFLLATEAQRAQRIRGKCGFLPQMDTDKHGFFYANLREFTQRFLERMGPARACSLGDCATNFPQCGRCRK